MENDGQPPWADNALAQALELLCASGESQTLEFKRIVPPQVSDLAKEIAGFATSNAGSILIGVADDGAIAGLPELADRAARQAFIARIEGICANAVKPSITPTLRFARIAEGVIAAIDIPKGSAPVYYASDRPYLRQLTAARPMMPDEVIEAILTWDRARTAAEDSPEAQYFSGLASLLVDIIARASELEVRDYGEGLETTRYHLGAGARTLRDFIVEAPSECKETVEPLRVIAAQLDNAAHQELMMGSGWTEMVEAAEAALAGAKAFADQYLKPEFFSPETITGLEGTIATVAARQDDLTGRIETMIDEFRLDELRGDAGAHGLTLRKAGVFLTMLGQAERGAVLDAIGARLREIELRETYLDGGRSQRQIVADLESANADLQAFVHGEPAEGPGA